MGGERKEGYVSAMLVLWSPVLSFHICCHDEEIGVFVVPQEPVLESLK